MKQTLIFISLITFLFAGCANYRELTKDETEAVFVHEVPLSKEVLKTKILTFLNEYFMSAKATIQTVDDGLITANYNTVVTPSSIMDIYGNQGHFTVMIKYENNSIKVKNMLKDVYSGATRVHPANWGIAAEGILAEYKKFDKDLMEYLLNKNNDF